MKPTDPLACKLLCASAAAYCIKENSETKIYPADKFICTGTNTINQYNAIGFIDNVYAVNVGIEGCSVGKTATELIVAFRGTISNSYLDWIQDALAKPESYPDIPGKVHFGFRLALKLIQDEVKKAIDSLDPKHSLPIYITGHSKGGGMAPIAAMFFKNAYDITAKNIITFAGPKPGNGDFAKAYDTTFPNALRYENYLDIVPLLPPADSVAKLMASIITHPEVIHKLLLEATHWGYHEVATLVYIDDKGQIGKAPAMITRVGEIAYHLATDGPSAIGNAHSSACGHRYMQGTCQGSVCKFKA